METIGPQRYMAASHEHDVHPHISSIDRHDHAPPPGWPCFAAHEHPAHWWHAADLPVGLLLVIGHQHLERGKRILSNINVGICTILYGLRR